MSKFICVHLGARAHYIIPKSLEISDRLASMITDTWISSGITRSFLGNIPIRMIKSFSNRYSSQIASRKVYSFNIRFFFLEIYIRLKYKDGWEQILARNYFFQQLSIPVFNRLPADSAVLGTSYTSLTIFRKAKQRKQKTILFQIDPGFIEEEIVAEIVTVYGKDYPTNWKRAPPIYWNNWREECLLADIILVNSEWSKKTLMKAGVISQKIKIAPLPFPLEDKHLAFVKRYPDSFSSVRPLRCLFLGSLILRKGIHLVLEVAKELSKLPIEFILVGRSEIDESLFKKPNIIYKGIVTREETDNFYSNADIFLFTSLSDGFGLTQLEAMAWQLPVIASKHCGEVVVHNYNGIVLTDCLPQLLTKTIINFMKNPSEITRLSSNCLATVKQYSIEKFTENLSSLV